jgi:DNA-binding NarL/FixJ family response regulator
VRGLSVDTLLERHREIDALRAAADDVGYAGGRAILIEAAPGLGKTRLLGAAREIACAAGLEVLTARATELERDFPFAMVRQLFEPGLTAMPETDRSSLLDGPAEAARGALGLTRNGAPSASGDTYTVLYGLYRMMAAWAQRRPLMLALDDVHWSDPASLDFTGFLLPRLEELAVLVVVTARPGEADASPGLARIADDASVQRLHPRALSGAAATELLTAELDVTPSLEFAAVCHEVSGGNPFLLNELVRTLADRGIVPSDDLDRVRDLTPERVAHNVLLRLRRRSAEARSVARALVVLGDHSDQRLMSAHSGLGVDAARNGADELRAAGILAPGASLQFIHPLVRNAVASELGPGERAAEHARAAALLREDGAGPEALAAQLIASEPCGDRTTVLTLIEAGTRALSVGALRSAVACLARAHREPAPPDLYLQVLTLLLLASILSADHAVYDAIEPEVLAELERVPQLGGNWAPLLAWWLAANERVPEAVSLMQRTIDATRRQGEIEQAFRLEAQLSVLISWPLSGAQARLRPYFDDLGPGSDGRRLAEAVQAEWSMFGGSMTEAVEHARRALDGIEAALIRMPELVFPAWHIGALVAAEQYDEALQAADRTLAVAREVGATVALAGASSVWANAAWHRGELAAAETALRRAVETARLGGVTGLVAPLGAWLAGVLIDRGELRAAETVLSAPDMTPSLSAYGYWYGLSPYARGRLQLAQGRPEQAARTLLAMDAHARRFEAQGNPLTPIAAYAARAFCMLGERARADALAEEALTHAMRWGAPGAISCALRAKALVVGGADGLVLLRQAVSGMEDSPARLERAHALAELGGALRRANQRSEAREPLRKALALARACGAAGLARRVADDLEACGERRRRHTPIGVASLTPSERRVAEMAASGLTNRQIAQTLYLTVKTVETHLSATYDKLAIQSRRQLPDALAA